MQIFKQISVDNFKVLPQHFASEIEMTIKVWSRIKRKLAEIRSNKFQNSFPCSINPLNAELNPIRHLLALVGARHIVHVSRIRVNPLNAELNPIRHLLALVGARHIVHVSRIRVNLYRP